LNRRKAVDELIELLRAEEGRRVAKWTTTPTQNPPMKYANREDVRALLREAAAALEAAREDAGKWAILSMRRGDWPELDIAMEDAEAAIDQARGKAGGEVGE
jgi:hypothetical protein